MDYKETLNLPKTDFPMKANLPQREPQILERWEHSGMYRLLREQHPARPRYVLHDGPPYANGHIHIGHALNKILKDIIVKSKTMEGMAAPYLPGWDCHGLPIEYQVLKDLGPKKHLPAGQAGGMSTLQIRKLCREYAEKFVKVQREEFKRLGVFGDWEEPYLTMTPGYEAAIVREFGKIVETGSVYKGKKPVLWCSHDETALAEAEVEYEEHTSPSIYVKFRVTRDVLDRIESTELRNLSFLIWTTTPWTLVANEAVCLHPDFDYQAVRVNQEGKSEQTWIIAKELVGKCMKEFGIETYSIVKTFKGEELKHYECRSPFVEYPTGDDWTSKVILGAHVTLDQGTGCVHTAPGHGQEDYEVGRAYDLPIYAPLDNRGRFTDEINPRVHNLVGIEAHKANEWIIKRLSEIGTLVKGGTLTHSYPHCWRCKKPVIFRATEQWFISMEINQLRQKALAEIDKVKWIPRWGRERIYGMIENRPDWCISRQRVWGVPIVAFTCTGCKEVIVSQEIANHVADQMEGEGGSDIWFSKSAQELIPNGTICPRCKGSQFQKEKDILDVWFESGVSHAAVLKRRRELHWPADLYLEGSDQHRGWFHSALLTSLLTDERAPYKAVLTHGFVVDGSGKKMSKSAGNVVAPQEVIQKYGAEILRLWVASTDFREDVRISPEILAQLVETYRKIRNTCRFLLGNLYDFDPARDGVGDASLLEIDRWALGRLQHLIQRVRRGYADYEFHIIVHALNNFCAVEMSAVYLDVLKDRLYVSRSNSPERRAAQRVLYEVLVAMTQLMAPILSFTAEEIWGSLRKGREGEIVYLTGFPDVRSDFDDVTLASRWARLLLIREEVSRVLETARQKKEIGHSLEAAVTLYAGGELLEFLRGSERDLPMLLIVSVVMILPIDGDNPQTLPAAAGLPVDRPANARPEICLPDRQGGMSSQAVAGEVLKELGILVEHASGDKCERCWMYLESVGKDAVHPTLCARCVGVLSGRADA